MPKNPIIVMLFLWLGMPLAVTVMACLLPMESSPITLVVGATAVALLTVAGYKWVRTRQKK